MAPFQPHSDHMESAPDAALDREALLLVARADRRLAQLRAERTQVEDGTAETSPAKREPELEPPGE